MFNNNLDVLNELKEQKESHLKMALEMGRVGSALVNIEKMLTKTIQTYTSENKVLQSYTQTFRAEGYLYNSLIIGDSAAADNTKLIIGGNVPTYTVPLVAGENAVNIPDGATYYVTTTSGKPVTALLTRYNTPGNNDTNVTLQSALPSGANIIGNVGISGAIPTGSNRVGNIVIQDTANNVVGTNFPTIDAQGAFSSVAGLVTVNVPYSYNGNSWDRVYNNTQGVLLPSAARTVSTTSANITNYNSKGIKVFLNVTSASGTGGLQVYIRTLDPVSGSTASYNAPPTTVTATGLYVYEVYPGLGSSGSNITQRTNGSIDRIIQAFVFVNDATSYTYSLGYTLTN